MLAMNIFVVLGYLLFAVMLIGFVSFIKKATRE